MSEPSRVARSTLATVGVVLAVVVAHVLFVVRDLRLPRDRGLYYRHVPDITAALEDGSWAEALGWVVQPGGWYQVLLGLWLHVLGRSTDVFQFLDVVWVGSVVALSAAVARVLAASTGRGAVAGLVAACLTGGAAIVVVTGRMSWIHLPEAALALLALLVLLRDPELRAPHTIAVAAVTGLLAIALRPSGIVWFATLALLLIGPGRSGRFAQVFAIGTAWAAAVALQMGEMDKYLSAKLDARSRYAEQVPDLIQQIPSTLTWPVAAFGAVGLALAVVRAWRLPGAAVVASWLLVPLVLVAIFRAGLDNFTLVGPALAIAAGAGFASSAPRVGLGAVLVFLVAHLPQYLPDSRGPLRSVIARLGVSAPMHPLGYGRPYTLPDDLDVLALLAATCPEASGSCAIAVDQGLFQPYSEDPGALELFIGGYDEVRLYSLTAPPSHFESVNVLALLNYDCGTDDEPWRRRYPQSMTNLNTLATKLSLQVAWEGQPRIGRNDVVCKRLWLTPGGEVARAEALPPAGHMPDDQHRPGDGAPGQQPPRPMQGDITGPHGALPGGTARPLEGPPHGAPR